MWLKDWRNLENTIQKLSTCSSTFTHYVSFMISSCYTCSLMSCAFIRCVISPSEKADMNRVHASLLNLRLEELSGSNCWNVIPNSLPHSLQLNFFRLLSIRKSEVTDESQHLLSFRSPALLIVNVIFTDSLSCLCAASSVTTPPAFHHGCNDRQDMICWDLLSWMTARH